MADLLVAWHSDLAVRDGAGPEDDPAAPEWAMTARVRRTKPRQAASPATVDRWQRAVQAMLQVAASLQLSSPSKVQTLHARLARLLASMRRSERR